MKELHDASGLDELWSIASEPGAARRWLAEAARLAASDTYATASLGLHRPEPFWHERFRVARGRRLDAPPRDRRMTEHYMFDQRGSLVAIDEFEYDPVVPAAREVMVHDVDCSRSIRWRGGEPELVREVRFAGDEILAVEAIEHGNAWIERYERDENGRIAVIFEPRNREPPDGLGWRDSGGALRIEYGDAGELLSIVGPGSGDVVYRAPPRPFETILVETAERIAADVRSWTLNRDMGGAVACVVLVYGDADSIVPDIAFETERARAARQGASDPEGDSPHGLPRPIDIWENDIPVASDYDFEWIERVQPWLEQELPLAGLGSPASSVLARAARVLNESWIPSFQTTHDFVVFCADHEGSELEADIRASIPQTALDRLVRR